MTQQQENSHRDGQKGLCCLDGGGHLQFFSTVISGLGLLLIEGDHLIGERLMKVQL